MHILLVDNEPQVAQRIGDIAREDDHELTVAQRGSQALTAALSSDFDLLICDIELPDLQGTEVVRALKAQAPQLPVIVLSALDADTYRPQVEEAGASCYLQKPLDADALRQEIRLVAQARAALSIVLIDPDPIHRVRLTKTLEPLGCTVHAYEAPGQARDAVASADASQGAPSLLMLEASVEQAVETLEWAQGAGIPAFVYADPEQASREDVFMRAGASLFLTKPIDTDALLTQARFLANF